MNFALFKNFCDEIVMDNSRSYKLSVLEKYKDIEDVKYYLDFVFNPYITTGISKKKINTLIAPATTSFTPYDCCEYIKVHNTGALEDVSKVLKCMIDIPLSERDLFKKVITKDLQLGVDVLSINKVMNDFIPTFTVQLANKYFDKPEVVNGKEFSLTTKIDGGRIVAIKENGVCKFFTRAGQEYEGLVDLENEMSKMPDGIALDGEITLLCTNGMASKDQYKATMKITRKDGEKHGIKMKVFDILPAKEFRAQKSTMIYKDRRAMLDVLFGGSNFTYFELLPVLYSGTDVNMIPQIHQRQVSNGEEGIMINMNDATYQFKRTNELLKVKSMQDLDLTIIDFEEGDNKYKGTLGAVMVGYKGNVVKVGSGFTDEERDEIWSHKNDYRGMTAVVQYFEETYNSETGEPSLRFPIWQGVRTDK